MNTIFIVSKYCILLHHETIPNTIDETRNNTNPYLDCGMMSDTKIVPPTPQTAPIISKIL